MGECKSSQARGAIRASRLAGDLVALLNGHRTGISELYLPGGVRGHMSEQTVGTDCKGTLSGGPSTRRIEGHTALDPLACATEFYLVLFDGV